MATEQFSNAAQTTLNGSITSGSTSMTVTSATGFPSSGNFRCLLSAEGANTNEIVTVTGVSGTAFTISRATEAYAGVQSASAHASGATVTQVLTHGGLSQGIADGMAGTTPSLADQTIAYVNNASSASISVPSAAATDDWLFIWAWHYFAVNTPSGWGLVESSTGSNANGAVFYKKAVSGDLGGSVTVTFGGTGYGDLIMAAVRGGDWLSDVGQNRTGSTGTTLTSSYAFRSRNADLTVVMGGARASSTTVSFTTASTVASRTSDTNAGAAIGKFITTGGPILDTATSSVSATGMYIALITIHGPAA